MHPSIYVVLGVFAGVLLFEVILIGRRLVLAKRNGNRAVPVSQHVPNATTHVLVVGDSTAYGTGAEEQQNSLVGRLARNFPHIHIDNAAENGMGLDVLRKKLDTMSGRSYDITMLHIGGIDVLSMTTDAKIITALKDIFEKARALLKSDDPRNIVFVSVNNVGCAPAFRFPLNRLLERRSRRLNGLFQVLADEHEVTHVSLFCERDDDPFAARPDELYASDGIHPNDAGYELWYDKINQKLTLRHQ